MERLTFESDGYLAVRGKDCLEDQNGDYFGPAVARLAAYEETGLTPDDVVDLMGNHAMALGELAKVPKWIPVTEKLPKNEDYVLVCTRSRNGSRNVDKGYCYNGGWAHIGTAKVTHWMPLPRLPEKEGS